MFLNASSPLEIISTFFFKVQSSLMLFIQIILIVFIKPHNHHTWIPSLSSINLQVQKLLVLIIFHFKNVKHEKWVNVVVITFCPLSCIVCQWKIFFLKMVVSTCYSGFNESSFLTSLMNCWSLMISLIIIFIILTEILNYPFKFIIMLTEWWLYFRGSIQLSDKFMISWISFKEI